MSAPTPAHGDDRPREGYYPDPSIPGYVRYWNGTAWVPGTSRPAPADGEPLTAPSTSGPDTPPVEETGPHFFEEGGSAGGPAAQGEAPPDTFLFRRPTPGPAAGGSRDDGTMTFRRVRAEDAGAGQGAEARGAVGGSGGGEWPGGAGAGGAQEPGRAEQFGAAGAGSPGPAAGAGPVAGAGAATPQGPVGHGAFPAGGTGRAGAGPAQAAVAPPVPSQGLPGAADPRRSGPPPRAAAPQGPAPVLPPQAQAGGLLAPGPGGGQASWAQQVHQLAGAGEEQPVAPWKPPVEDPFLAVARRQAEARPAGLGKRFAARLIDNVFIGAVTAAAAVPLGVRAVDHTQSKIEAARLSGRTVTVWLLDGTTGVSLALVLGVLLVFGVVYEVLPTARWGRTLGKRLCGIQVRDIEGHQPPSFGAALRRWLVYSLPGVLVIGVIGVLWGLFDRPWRQCWHDKAAHTFVAE
ncbi:RDD family protein [Streptomyces griseoluteus]|uniref:RDD family protein n=1 Tax=Streptomyces griseoluteus TaxID=29306 RepID=UPI003321A5BE